MINDDIDQMAEIRSIIIIMVILVIDLKHRGEMSWLGLKISHS